MPELIAAEAKAKASLEDARAKLLAEMTKGVSVPVMLYVRYRTEERLWIIGK